MANKSPAKRKSQNHEAQTPKKQKLNENPSKTPNSKKKNVPKKQNTPKDGNKNKTPKSQKKNKEKPIEEAEEESDYEVEQEVKPEKITKTMNEDNVDSDDSVNEAEDDSEEIDNAVNENSENDKKKKTNKKKNIKNIEKKSDVDKEEEIKAFIEAETAKGKGKMRYVLFLGNLSYETTSEDIEIHFSNGIKIKHVRIPRGKGPEKKPRGFGYLEVEDKESYLKALSMHHTFIKGRRINVQYTTGGKKNSANTKKLLKKKNFKLNALRKDGKLDGNMKHSNKRSVRRAKKRTFEKKTE